MAIGAAIIGAVGAAAQIIQGANQASKARKAIERYQRQELKNAYEGLSVSTLGADLQREEMARATATGVEALRSGGTRALVGGIGLMQQGVTQQSRQISSDLDQQQMQIDYARAGGDERLLKMQETREEQDLAGLGNQLYVGQQNMYSGIGNMAQVAGAAGGLMGGVPTSTRNATASVNELKPKGATPLMGGAQISNPFMVATGTMGGTQISNPFITN